MQLKGKSFYLKTLKAKNLNADYFSWLNDKNVTKYLNLDNFVDKNKKKLFKDFKKYDQKKNFFFGIFTRKENKFIGTITLLINTRDKIGYIGFLVGDKAYWGTNAAFEAVKIILRFSFSKHKLFKIWGVTITENIGAILVLKKNKFVQEGYLRQHVRKNNKQYDRLMFGILKRDWQKYNK
jgi:[ribosomal protein S5]-alanine N-acetyltransferase